MRSENLRLARFVRHREHFKCEMCGKTKFAKMYEYQPASFVQGYIPPHLKKMCGDCIYRECYGTNIWKKKKKEGTLDDL